MSLNGYSYVEGNVGNATDPSGLQATCLAGDIQCLLDVGGFAGAGQVDPCTLDPEMCISGGGITLPPIAPPDYGDFTTRDLLNLCNFLNGGACSRKPKPDDEEPSIVSIEGLMNLMTKIITCTASCALRDAGAGPKVCTGYIFGTASGTNENQACKAAKKAAGPIPTGCFKGHCQCKCSK
jgi:hypothetical protein